MEKGRRGQQVRVNLHVATVNQLLSVKDEYNKMIKSMDIKCPTNRPQDELISESEAVEFCINEYMEDCNSDTIKEMISVIERIRDANETDLNITKTFRLRVEFYDVVRNIKRGLNKYNKINRTYTTEDVLEYLIQTYSCNV